MFSFLDEVQECLDCASFSPASCLEGIVKADEALRHSQGDSGIQCTILMKRAQLLFIAVSICRHLHCMKYSLGNIHGIHVYIVNIVYTYTTVFIQHSFTQHVHITIAVQNYSGSFFCHCSVFLCHSVNSRPFNPSTCCCTISVAYAMIYLNIIAS